MQPVKVRKVRSREDLKEAFAIRLRVFVREQGVPAEIELDEDDKRATHFLADVGGKVVGTARLKVRRGRAKIGRMAVLKSYRGRGVGRELLKRAVGLARKNGAKIIFLHAQIPVIGFYEKMGFRCVGRAFVEAGIPHRRMVLTHKRSRRACILRRGEERRTESKNSEMMTFWNFVVASGMRKRKIFRRESDETG